MIKVKAEHFLKAGDVLRARVCLCNESWWLRENSTPKESCFDGVLSFKTFLRWDEDKCDKKWIDRNKVHLLLYAVSHNDAHVVESILKSDIDVRNRLNIIVFDYGLDDLGIPAQLSVLHIAMSCASVSIVKMLLESGANPYINDKYGVDSLMCACTLGRVKNVKFWLSKFQDWDIHRGNAINGSTALHCAIYFGRNKMKTVQALLENSQASLDVLNHGGASVLCNAVNSVDSNVDVIRYLLSKGLKFGVNHRRQSQTVKWKAIYGIARGLSRVKIMSSGLLRSLAWESGSTPIHYAVRRGDVEVVELLMEYSADPFIKNDLGRDALSYCEAFPEIKRAIKRIKREGKHTQQHENKKLVSSNNFTLQRRLSTATDIKRDMYLMNLSTMIKLFGSPSDRKKNFHLCHQDLLEKGKLTRFEDLPLGSFVVFVSHQWNGFNHPDPSGGQMQVLSKVLCNLRDGVYKTEMDPFHVLLYETNITTSVSEWKELLINVYIWYDWFSQPQPSRGTSKEEIERLSQELILSLDSVSAYVERADTLIILAPSSVHADIVNKHSGKKTYTCYRTWRRRGFCVLEFCCAVFSRRSTHPVLLVRSEMDAPIWISPHESLKLAVGECDFTCCETNHRGHAGDSEMQCSRKKVRRIMSKMIDAKANHLSVMKNVLHERWTRVLKHWWMRGLDEKGWVRPSSSSSQKSPQKDLETWLNWDDNVDGTFFDRNGVSLLLYAVCSNDFEAVLYLLTEINKSFKNDSEERKRRVESRISKQGFLFVGIPGCCTTLIGAMTLGSPEIVRLLLENGAFPHYTDVTGHNPFMCACTYNRVDNVKFWLKQFPDWDLEARNTVVGSTALSNAVYCGPNRLELTRYLLDRGANMNVLSHSGSSVLLAACDNEDADPDVVRLILDRANNKLSFLNFKRSAQTFEWRLKNLLASIYVRFLSQSKSVLKYLAEDIGETALHEAVRRGDVEIAEILLRAGADPCVKSSFGKNAETFCDTYPELRGLLNERVL